MHAYSAWNIDASQILTRGELAQVLADLKRRSPRLPNVQMNLAIVRLESCCGLRASEIAGLRLGDVHTGVTRPFLSIRAETAKGGKPRRQPLASRKELMLRKSVMNETSGCLWHTGC